MKSIYVTFTKNELKLTWLAVVDGCNKTVLPYDRFSVCNVRRLTTMDSTGCSNNNKRLYLHLQCSRIEGILSFENYSIANSWHK